MKEFHIVNDEDAWAAAYVEQDDEDNTKWNITLNLAAIVSDGEVSEEWKATLIHEFAHILTLSKTQVRYYPVSENGALLERFAENCTTNLVQEWCLLETAYLDDFIDTFWTDAEDLRKAQEEEWDVYTGNESNFITDYAATNPGEDIAESFTYFVINSKPSGPTIADKKLLFFYNYPELDTLRKQIRSRLQK